MSDGDGRGDDATTAPADPDQPDESPSDGDAGDDLARDVESDDDTGNSQGPAGVDDRATEGVAEETDGRATDDAPHDDAPAPHDDEPVDDEAPHDDAPAPHDDEPVDDEAPLDPAEVDVAELTGPERSLEPAVRLLWMLRAALAAVVLGSVAGALSVVLSGPVWVGPVVFTALFVLGTTRAHFRYKSWSYRVRTDSLFLDRGVLTRVRTVVPYVRIQHVDASRGPAERAFGLATVVVYTAGSRGADVTIPGLTPERADDLQERLKRLAIAAEGEDAV